ncbi:MAG: type II toxin-antitoxin system VapC family toxin [Rubrivivax sp.]|nr:type II toxin-antitoxin system VapC family toxin [Rubrivivax sp.]
MKPALRRAVVAEPPPQYQTRPPAVVDCSMLCAVLFDEPEREAAEDLMSGHRLLAPTLLVHEFVNVALKKLRRGLPADVVERAMADFSANDIELLPTDALLQFALARQYGLSAYDAAYLWLAAELRAPLITYDQKLGRAAMTHLRSLD